jgi:hypothetical protein
MRGREMPVVLSIAGGIFVLLSLVYIGPLMLRAKNPDDVYFSLAISLSHTSVFVFLLLLLIVFLAVGVYLSKQASLVAESNPTPVFMAGVLLILSLLIASSAGSVFRERLEKKCVWADRQLMIHRYTRHCYRGGRWEPLEGQVWTVGLYDIVFFVTPAVLPWLLLLSAPAVFTGYVVATSPTPANRPISRATSHNHPTNVTRELARIMAAQEIDDRRAHALINQMSPLQQFIAKVKYSKRIQEAERLRALVEKRVSAIQSETRLAHETLEMERKKRGR